MSSHSLCSDDDDDESAVSHAQSACQERVRRVAPAQASTDECDEGVHLPLGSVVVFEIRIGVRVKLEFAPRRPPIEDADGVQWVSISLGLAVEAIEGLEVRHRCPERSGSGDEVVLLHL